MPRPLAWQSPKPRRNAGIPVRPFERSAGPGGPGEWGCKISPMERQGHTLLQVFEGKRRKVAKDDPFRSAEGVHSCRPQE